MLLELRVENLGIIAELGVRLGKGMTVITGETGAGKSILVDAIALLAGGRGSSDLIREGAARLVVAGEFDGDASMAAVLAQAGLPESRTVLLRRELSPDGRGRAKVSVGARNLRAARRRN
jgi:DNA repair protein RecN (Recombination protein N)